MDESGTFLTELKDDRRKIAYKLKKLPPIKQGQPEVDYDNLELLSKTVEDSSLNHEESHQWFMANYPMIFRQNHQLQPIEQSVIGDREKTKKDLAGRLPGENSHNIAEHLAKLRKHAGSPQKEAAFEERFRIIRKIGKKMLFDRTTKDNQQLQQALSYLECFSHMPKKILTKLVATAQLEKWESGYTVLGDSGLYLILKGSASPLSTLTFNDTTNIQRKESFLSLASGPDSYLQSLHKLSMGDHFGTLEKVPENELNTRNLSVMTLENCELLRFSNSSFERVVKQIKQQEIDEKLQLAQSCNIFTSWPVMSLKKVSETFTWSKVPAGEILAIEGAIATKICFIKSGKCQLKKMISVAFQYPDGKKCDIIPHIPLFVPVYRFLPPSLNKMRVPFPWLIVNVFATIVRLSILPSGKKLEVKKKKEIVTGLLKSGDCFGERSLMSGQPMEHSVISETSLSIASINMTDIKGLDDVTRALFRQTCEAADSATSEEKIQMQYVEKQAELDWQSMKDTIVNETLYYRGIQPGYS